MMKECQFTICKFNNGEYFVHVKAGEINVTNAGYNLRYVLGFLARKIVNKTYDDLPGSQSLKAFARNRKYEKRSCRMIQLAGKPQRYVAQVNYKNILCMAYGDSIPVVLKGLTRQLQLAMQKDTERGWSISTRIKFT